MIHKKITDFRSDTVTRPNQLMYDAMVSAKLGDDGLRDDPTVIELEEKAAKLTGKEKALLFPSGTMANQVAVRTHCTPGKEVIVEDGNHILNYEKGALAYAMVQVRSIKGHQGTIDVTVLRDKLHKGNSHRAETGLICLENPYTAGGGCIIDQKYIIELSNIAHEKGIPVHLDGARIFNAQVATGTSVSELVAPADSIMFCLSKGLGAPVGSMLCGSQSFIQKARTIRQFMGGTMRQAGILAACGLEALNPDNINHLAEDHRRTKELAASLTSLPYINLLNLKVDTNILYLSIQQEAPFNAYDLIVNAKKENILLMSPDINTIRIVCHKDIDDRDVKKLTLFFIKWCSNSTKQ